MAFLHRCRHLAMAGALGAFVATAGGIGAWLATGAPAAAAVPAGSDQADVQKAEDYLNSIKTLQARFMQVAPDGGTAEGTVYLSRPGRMRLEYDPPSPVLVVADGTFLIYYDKKLQQTSYLGLDSSPAGVLVQPDVKLNGGDLKVTKIAHPPGLMDITVTKKSDPAQGHITLVFTQSPFQLKQWQVTDQQGQITTVSLFDARSGVSLDKKLFVFNDPKFQELH
jgi:outer membrane lipoprotein-sorting protein